MKISDLELYTRLIPKHAQNQTRMAINKIINSVRLSGSSVFRGFHIDGLSQISVLIDRKYQQHARHDINEILNNIDREWQVWIGLFGYDANGEEVCDIETATNAAVNASTLGQWVDNVLHDLVNTGRDWQAVGYGWVATPSAEASVDDSDELIIKHFKSIGIYDIKKRDALIEEVLAEVERGENTHDLYEIDGNVFERVYQTDEEKAS